MALLAAQQGQQAAEQYQQDYGGTYGGEQGRGWWSVLLKPSCGIRVFDRRHACWVAQQDYGATKCIAYIKVRWGVD